MAYSSNHNSGLEWDDAEREGGNEPFFNPSYYVHSPSHSLEASEKKYLKCAESPTASPCIRYNHNHAYAFCVNSWGSGTGQLSRYSCSRNSFSLHGSKKARMPSEDEEENVWCGYYYVPTSWMCICLQIILWSLVTMGVFIVLFSVATRPRSPGLSVKKIACRNFGVGEGSDKSGVPTKVLSCSCNVSLDLDNRSDFFGVHVRPAHITIAFEDLIVATGHGREVYVDRDSTMTLEVKAEARRKAVYGAGPSMAHLLHSAEGLPLVVRISMESSIRVVWAIVNPNYSHHLLCHLLLHATAAQHHLNLSQFHCSYT